MSAAVDFFVFRCASLRFSFVCIYLSQQFLFVKNAMDVYAQAAGILRAVHGRNGTAKGLCLQSAVQKKKQTYAVVCETFRRLKLIDAILNKVSFYSYFPSLDSDELASWWKPDGSAWKEKIHAPQATMYSTKDLVRVLAYDAIFGVGVKTRKHPACVAVNDSLPFFKEAHAELQTEFPIQELLAEGTVESQLSKYARHNPLSSISQDDCLLQLNRSLRTVGAKSKRQSSTEDLVQDEHIPGLWKLPARADFHAHPLVTGGHVVLQDKSSCFPAAVLFRRVSCKAEVQQAAFSPLRILDACSAPGNKTSQLAGYLHENIQHEVAPSEPPPGILAIEKNAKRFRLLNDRMKQLGHDRGLVSTFNEDFLQLDADTRQWPDAILLDPSCSASGVVSRIDVSVQFDEQNADRSEETQGEEATRIAQLAEMQTNLLVHALTEFPNVKRVVYSTCSIHEEECERVVAEAIGRSPKGWRLSNIMPTNWVTRGRVLSDTSASIGKSLSRCIRCDPRADHTNGFFVAAFDRE